MPDIALRGVPLGLQPELADFLNSLREGVIAIGLGDDPAAKVTTAQLLAGSATAVARRTKGSTLPPVSKYRVEVQPNSFMIYLAETPPYSVELWRSVGAGAESSTAVRVGSTTGTLLEDHPPPGENWRYFLRYVDGEQFGPFVPQQGLPFTSAGVANPEDVSTGAEGLAFLETFEDENFHSKWVERAGNTPVVTYPTSGVVGGKVARATGEAWRAAPTLLSFDASQLYRMKVGVRMSAAPSSGGARVRFGVECYDDDKIMIDTFGGTNYLNAHWFCAFDVDLNLFAPGTYVEFTGYLQGLGTTPANNANTVIAPSVARNGTRYIRPVAVINYDNGNGTTEIDYIRLEGLAKDIDTVQIAPSAATEVILAIADDVDIWVPHPIATHVNAAVFVLDSSITDHPDNAEFQLRVHVTGLMDIDNTGNGPFVCWCSIEPVAVGFANNQDTQVMETASTGLDKGQLRFNIQATVGLYSHIYVKLICWTGGVIAPTKAKIYGTRCTVEVIKK